MTNDEDRRMTIRIPESMAKEIDNSIERSGMPFAEWVRRAFRDKLDQESGDIHALKKVEDERVKQLMRDVLEEFRVKPEKKIDNAHLDRLRREGSID
jgi:Arc/MetJ-type ribon-helix-helix transcriptional regulator